MRMRSDADAAHNGAEKPATTLRCEKGATRFARDDEAAGAGSHNICFRGENMKS